MQFRLLLVWTLIAAQMAGAKGDLHLSVPQLREVLHAVIQQQLVAFRANDYNAAYRFADDGIKERFSPNEFEEMVRTAFQAIAHSATATFGLTFDNGDEAVVNVRVTSAAQEAAAYQYLLRRTGTQWRIAGVAPVRDEIIEA